MKAENDCTKTVTGKRRIANPDVYKKTMEFQQYMAENGFAWHNPFGGECTEDFGCCGTIGQYEARYPSYYTVVSMCFDEVERVIKERKCLDGQEKIDMSKLRSIIADVVNNAFDSHLNLK